MLGGTGGFSSQPDSNENKGLTIEKLPEIKIMFDNAKKQNKNGSVRISKVRELAYKSPVSEADLNEFFKDFLVKGREEISVSEFENHTAKVERVLLEMCLGGKNEGFKEQSEYVASNALAPDDSEIQDGLSKMPKEGEELKGHYLGPDDYTLDDYISAIKEMVYHNISNDNFLDMSLADVGKLVKDIYAYINIVKKKADKLSEELKDTENKLENKEYQETFLQNKIRNYQDTIEELQAAKDKLEQEVAQMFTMEKEFQKLRDRNADLDMQLLESSQEIQKLSSQNSRMERELNQLKRQSEELRKEAMNGQSEKAELWVELEKYRSELEKVKKEKEAASKVAFVEKPVSEKEQVMRESNSDIAEIKGENKTEEVKKEVKEVLGNDSELRRNVFELKKKLDSLQSKIDDYMEENNRLQQDNEKYIADLQKKGIRIKELELVCSELEEEKAYLAMQLRNVDFIQRQDEKDKPRLSIAYMKATAQQDPADPFRPSPERSRVAYKTTETVTVPDKPHVISEGGAEDFSLAKQLGIDESGLARPSTLDKVFSASETVKDQCDDNVISIGEIANIGDNKFEPAAEVKKMNEPMKASGEKIKVRASNLFQSKEYFKSKTRRDLETITEDENSRAMTEYAAEKEVQEEAAKKTATEAGMETEEGKKESDIDKKVTEESKTEQKVPEESKTEQKEPEEDKVKQEAIKEKINKTEPQENKDQKPSVEEEKKAHGTKVSTETLTQSPTNKKKVGEEVSIGTEQVPAKPAVGTAKVIQEKFANKIKEQNKKVAAALGSSGMDVRPSRVTTFDFLTLKKNDKITKMLTTQKEAGSPIIFSDYIYIIREDDLSHKSKRILYITEYSFYVLHPRSYQIQRITPITDLKMIIIVKTSGTLIAFHFEKS